MKSLDERRRDARPHQLGERRQHFVRDALDAQSAMCQMPPQNVDHGRSDIEQATLYPVREQWTGSRQQCSDTDRVGIASVAGAERCRTTIEQRDRRLFDGRGRWLKRVEVE
jgi:hypothetical protein